MRAFKWYIKVWYRQYPHRDMTINTTKTSNREGTKSEVLFQWISHCSPTRIPQDFFSSIKSIIRKQNQLSLLLLQLVWGWLTKWLYYQCSSDFGSWGARVFIIPSCCRRANFEFCGLGGTGDRFQCHHSHGCYLRCSRSIGPEFTNPSWYELTPVDPATSSLAFLGATQLQPGM